MPAEGPPRKQAKMQAGAPVATLRTKRLMTAVKTPYEADGNIDFVAYDRLVEHQIANGVEGLIVGGTTGEGHLLGWDEHLILIAHTKAKFQGRIMVVGNTGSNHTAEAVYATRKGFAAGMDCALIINPYYGKTSARGVVMHLQETLNLGPGIVYNVPGRTGQDISPETIMELSKHDNFVGVKECMGNDRIRLLSAKGIACWSGNDDQCHEARHDCGGVGVISVTSNIVPGLFKQLMTERNDALNEKLKPLYAWLFTEPNPIGVNTMLMQLGVAEPVFRMPYTARDKERRVEAVALLKDIGFEHCPVFAKEGMKALEDSDFKYVLGD